MEKFSKFRDPFTGIHPFLTPKRRTLRLSNYVNIMLRILILPCIFFSSFLKYFIKITVINKPKKGVYIANKSSILDKLILKKLFNDLKIIDLEQDKNYTIDRKKINVIFVEECRSNNKCLLNYIKETECDGAIGFRYSDQCVWLYGNFFGNWIYFLASNNSCTIKVVEGEKCLERATDLIRSKIGKNEFKAFINEVKLNK